MDNAITKTLEQEFEQKTKVDLSKDKQAHERLKQAIEMAKITLSSTDKTTINLPFLTMGPDKAPVHFVKDLYRSDLEKMISKTVERCIPVINKAFEECKDKISKNEITSIIMVGGPTKMPIIQKMVKETVGDKLKTGLDPMECVSRGAAIYAGVLGGDVKDLLLLDVLPLSLGIETLGGVTTTIVEANTTVPVKKNKIFSNAEDNQTTVTINVIEGEREFANDNISLNRFDLTGLDPVPRGQAQIEVTFDIDVNAMMTVTAKDLKSGKTATSKVSNVNKLSTEEVERMKKEAEENKEKDKAKRKEIEILNKAKTFVEESKKILEEKSDKLTAEQKKEAQSKIDLLQKAIVKKDMKTLEVEMENLEKAMQTVKQEMEKASKQQTEKAQAKQKAEKDDQQKAKEAAAKEAKKHSEKTKKK